MPTTLRIYHDRHYDLVKDESDHSPAGKVTYHGKPVKSTGEFRVIGKDGEEEQRHRISIPQKGNETYIELPDDWEPTPARLMQLVQVINERHAESADITGVAGDDAALAARVAALLDTEVVEAQ